MKALHFGAGNIGRGFIGALLYQAGYHTTFADVNSELVDLINERREYRVVLADDTHEELLVENVSAINSMTHPENLETAIIEADIITTAVGPSILPIIAKSLTAGLRKRMETNENPLNIIACENLIGGSSLLKKHVYDSLAPEEAQTFDQLFAFPDAAVDRIVPNQTNKDKLLVQVEPYYEWVVDESAMIGETPAIEGITYVADLTPYIERKLFTVNTGHAVSAYVGFHKGHHTIADALKDDGVRSIVEAVLSETGRMLVGKYSFDKKEHEQYIGKILGRFENAHIVDEVTRVARAPMRKLSGHDRLISPASQYFELFGNPPLDLVQAIAIAFTYDFQEDAEAKKIQALIERHGIGEAVHQVTTLEKDSPLLKLIVEDYQKLQ